MTAMKHHSIIILGSGPAGLSAALYTARAELKPYVFSGLLLYGQVSLTNNIENYPGFPEGISGAGLGRLFQEQAERFGAVVKYEQIMTVDLTVKPFEIKSYSNSYTADALIIATGADPRRLDVPGEKEFTGRGVSYCATCDGLFFKNRDVVVVGGGDSALEEGLFLTRFANSVTIIHRRYALRAAALLENKAKNNSKIKLLWDSIVTEIIGEDTITSVMVKNVKSGQEILLDTSGVFIFIGHIPNSDMFKDQLDLDNQGYIKVNNLMETNVPGVFAAGEVADPHFRQIVTSAGMGAAAGIQVVHYLESLEG